MIKLTGEGGCEMRLIDADGENPYGGQIKAPEKVITEILTQLTEETKGFICGNIVDYSGHVMSYTKTGFSSLAAIGTADKEVDIQNDLGKIGQETHKFECYLYTPEYDKYKYRVFFVKYDTSNYPVNIILEESVARSISVSNSGYVISCATREELEELMYKIFNSKKLISVMQELIRINQSKKALKDETVKHVLDEHEREYGKEVPIEIKLRRL